MLTIHKSVNSEAATQYFTNSLSTEGYYLDDKVEAKWKGKTVERLDLHGRPVTRENFSDLVNNVNRKTKERLTVRNADNRVAGIDFTYSAPKSISVMYALTKDSGILEAHRKACRQSMLAIETNMQTQANTQNERIYQRTGNIIYAAFDHFTTRPCEVKKNGKILYLSDPQLHTHCYVPNVTWNEEKQRFQALEAGNIHRLAPYYEAIYRSFLSYELNKLGYQTKRTHDRFEIEGVSRSVIERFSNRTKLIEQIAKEKNITDPKAKADLAVKTRHSKAKALSEEELYKHWKERLTKDEFEGLLKLKGKPQAKPKPISAKEAIDRSLEHFQERHSAFQEKRLLAHALTLGYGHLLPEDVSKELNSRQNILRSEIDIITYITTKEMVRAEDRMIELAVSGKGKFPPLNPGYKPKQDFLNEQQRKAINDILTSNDQVTILKGSAGVGKTSLLTEVREAVTSAGKSLFGVAPSSQATKVLKQKGFEADTIAALLHNPKLQERLQTNVLLVDEAGMCGVKTKSELLALVKKYNARCILSGDTRQHGPIQSGDALRILETQAQLKTVSVNKIMRQKPQDYKKAVEQLARGRTLEGYQLLNKMGVVKEIPDHDERLEKIADDYVGSITNNRTGIIVSPTNYEGELLNSVVREKLKAKGKIQGKEHVFDTLKSLSFTESQKKDLVNYSEGQVVRFTKNQKGGFKAGSHYEVLPSKDQKSVFIRDLKTGEKRKLPFQTPEHFQVYQKTQTQLAKGDLIRLTNNSITLEGTKINNGNSYQIKGFTKDAIKLSNGKTVPKDLYHYKHSYSETSYSSQGKTCQDVYISMSDLSFAATNEAALYVAASRGTHSVSIYTSDKTELRKAIAKSSERMAAREVAKDHDEQLLQRMQRNHHRSLNEKLREHGRIKQQEKQAARVVSTGLERG